MTTRTRGTVELAAGTARFVSTPVTAAGYPSGTFVAAVTTAPSRAIVAHNAVLQIETGAAAIVVASLLAWFAAGRVLRPVQQTTELARRITDDNLSERLPVRGHDEVSAMAATFNSMLDTLQAAWRTQRQFLADTGHELRTPITVIQGNLDTLSPASDDDVETLAIITDELARMTRLVDELSLLAASNRPEFLQYASTSVESLTTAIAAKCEALDTERRWSVTACAEGTTSLDPHRITQAVMQLAVNAATYTPPGSPIQIMSRRRGRVLEFGIIDHGSGIGAQDRDRVFERFVRLAPDRTASTGLGLAIVQAVAVAHGGRVGVTDTPGGGATFTLTVPWRWGIGGPSLDQGDSSRRRHRRQPVLR